ncbi:unnamed protein product [Brachionus calyciflorus]|uniref:Uncharacterized protein n=1 Tax=Brachionus calyciflorus TaxID=104777 RepID=A0A813MFC1_9BILA|nr:unnamed protein product [Brachionus calyciflorus]
MFKQTILICSIVLIGYSLVECGKNSNSADSDSNSNEYYQGVKLSSAERRYNRTCTSDYQCKNYEYGLQCLSGACKCPEGSNWITYTRTYTYKRGQTKTETKRFCDLTFDDLCSTKYNRCNPDLGLTCDRATAKCICSTGAWDGSVCGKFLILNIMNSEEELFNYYSRLTNEIDLQSETRLVSLDSNSVNDKVADDLVNLRLCLIEKSKEIEKISGEGCPNKIAVFIPNQINEQIRQKTFFKNMIGKFFILSEKLSHDLISKLSDVLNRKVKKFQRFTYEFETLQDETKFWIILDLLKYSESDLDSLDLTDPSNNKLKSLFFSSRKFPLINDYDLDILNDYVNLDVVSKITYDFPDLINPNNFNRFKNLTSLGISAKIEHVTADLFSQLENLEILKLIKCQIKTIDKDAFNNLKNLIYLNLNENSLELLEKYIFSNLLKLEKLLIKHNEIYYIDQDVFFWCKNLKEIDLSANRLFKIKSKIFDGNIELETLRIDQKFSKKEIVELNSSTMVINFNYLNKAKNLISLTLSVFNNNLAEIKLESLRLLVIKTSKVPKFRENFQNLQVLNLINVNTFPERCFINLKNLKMLKIILRNKQIIREINEQHFSGLEDLGYFLIEVNDPDPFWLRSLESVFLKLFNNITSSRIVTTSSSCKIEILNCESESNLKRRLIDGYSNE